MTSQFNRPSRPNSRRQKQLYYSSKEAYDKLMEQIDRIEQKAANAKNRQEFDKKIKEQVAEIIEQARRYNRIMAPLSDASYEAEENARSHFQKFMAEFQSLPNLDKKYLIIRLEFAENEYLKHAIRHPVDALTSYHNVLQHARAARTAINVLSGKKSLKKTQGAILEQ